ncbi:MAG TPA: cytochrome c [Acidobacteriota bacterium]|nr:cytochrome c [Acidobacteriota bacterium]
MRETHRTRYLYLTTAVLTLGTLACSSSQPPAAAPAPPPPPPEVEPRDVRAEAAEPAAAEPATPATTSVVDGVYTAEQSTRGEAVYRRACRSCHTPTLRGGVVIPPLVGEDFMGKWGRMSAGDLFERLRTTMPPSASRRLTREEYAEVVAFMLNKNGFPAGDQELGTEFDQLKGIQMQ